MRQKKDSWGEHITIWRRKTAWPKISQPETVFSHSSHGTGIGSGGSPPTFSGLHSSGKNPQVSTTNGNEAICRVFIQFMRQLSRKLFTGNSGQRIGSTSAILKIHQKWRLTISCIWAFHPETFYFCYLYVTSIGWVHNPKWIRRAFEASKYCTFQVRMGSETCSK